MACGAVMAKKRTEDVVSDKEAERRATEALRRALTTPYKPQKEITGTPRRVGASSSKKKKI